jgi:hypothetical protein
MRRCTLVLLASAIACADAFVAQPAARLPSRASHAARKLKPTMLAPEWLDALPQTDPAAALSLPSTVAISDIITDVAANIPDSPLILLVPIGGGLLVASIIIYILVKSAG